MSFRIFGAAALLSVLAQAANVNVINNCDFHVKATPSHEGTDDSPEYVAPGDTFSRPADGNAWCLKLYAPSGDGEWTSSPTQLEWSNPGGNTLFYDLSNIDMGSDTAFLQHGMNLSSTDPCCDSESSTCRPAICKAQGSSGKTSPCEDAYNQPFDTRTLGASANHDINMHLCTHDSHIPGHPASNAPSHNAPAAPQQPSHEDSPAPQYTTFATQAATTAAPAPSSYGGSDVQALAANPEGGPAFEAAPQNQGNPNIVTKWAMNTEVVTQIVTARDAEPTIAKRHLHMHHGHHNHAQ